MSFHEFISGHPGTVDHLRVLWRIGRDRQFGFFALAFFHLAINRLLLMFHDGHQEKSLAVSLVRLIAFPIILAAMLDKTLRSA